MTKGFEPSAIDRHFADFILGESQGASAMLKAAVALLSSAAGSGDICLNLAEIAGRQIRIDGEVIRIPGLENLQASLRKTPVIGSPGDFRPLVLDSEGRLYLYRYWKYERDLARVILAKAAIGCDAIDRVILADGLGRLFPAAAENGIDWQKVAALAALRKKFCIISGGPGTGKTSTVVKILALLLEQAKGAPLRITLAAPTGKAGARLKESIGSMAETLCCAAAVIERIPRGVSTIHRLLGPIAGSVRFRHSDKNPLPCDVVIVDEASMVALPLMAKLATALKADARLILLGDRDQLASVDAGAALGDMCGGGQAEIFSTEFSDLFASLSDDPIAPAPQGERLPPLADSLVVLKRNFRFAADSGIGAAAGAVNAGKGEDALAIITGGSADIFWHDMPEPDDLKNALADAVLDGYGKYLAAETAAEALGSFEAFRVLCALRKGPYGVADINVLIEKILMKKGLIDLKHRWYKGRPVLVTVNDYGLKLFNGDVGITFPDSEGDGGLRVVFPAPDGGLRKISPVRIPAHETAFAMTIHKSQGSEFNRVIMLLPGNDSPILTRELIYTGMTRAREKAEIWGSKDVFVSAVSRRTGRKSGLREALWPGSG